MFQALAAAELLLKSLFSRNESTWLTNPLQIYDLNSSWIRYAQFPIQIDLLN
jgi:hypothetical protein